MIMMIIMMIIIIIIITIIIIIITSLIRTDMPTLTVLLRVSRFFVNSQSHDKALNLTGVWENPFRNEIN